MRQVSDWMLKHIQDARSLFGVGGAEWHITAKLTDKPLGTDECNGSVTVDATYLNATIELHEDLEDNDVARDSVYHEVLHIPHEEIDHLVAGIIGELPADVRDRYDTLYHETVERFVQRVSRSICAGLRKESDE